MNAIEIKITCAWKTFIFGSLLLLAAVPDHARASDHPEMLGDLSLEALADVVITSVSKKEERKNQVAAAVFVLSGDEIRAHGAQTLAEALRLVPGISVARNSANSWSVSARGFNSSLADKMEVVLDGRSLYTPLFSGVWWDAQSTFMDDIERIEVIRGPGASVWGANAVHGVINIVTRAASETQGNVVNLGLGSEVKRQANVRHGGKIGERGHYRVYAQSSDYDSSESLAGKDNQDAWDFNQLGFRSDWGLASGAGLTVQGDAYEGELQQGNQMGEISGFNLLGRWDKTLNQHSTLSVQSYLDHTERVFPGQFSEDRDQIDLEIVHNFQFGERHNIVWGGGYRRSDDDIKGGAISFDPQSKTLETLSLFVQDQISLTETTTLTVGTKIEENDFTGTEVQPTLRLAWSPDPLHTLWGGLSRAIRTPNRVDNDISALGFAGSEDFESEVALTAETGYRFPFGQNANVDLVAFYTDYDKLRAVDASGPPPLMADNLGEGESWGVEVSSLWIPNSKTRLLFSYRYLDIDLEFPPTSLNGQLNADPTHEAFVRGSYALRDNLNLTAMLRYVDNLSADPSGLITTNQPVPSYTELNLGLQYNLSPRLEWSIHGQNLLDDSHQEFTGGAAIERSVFTQLKWRF